MSWFCRKSDPEPAPEPEPEYKSYSAAYDDPHANVSGRGTVGGEATGLPAAPGEDPGEVQPDVTGHGTLSAGLPTLGKRR